MEIEKAIVSANWRNRIPVVPGKNATGTNTATRTSEVAITAPVTSFMAADAARLGSLSPSLICRSMFSITTMASSTTSPVASVMPNSVRVLIENPSNFTKAKVPISDTGIVTDGMMVLRQSSRKIKITRMTSAIASIRVVSTSLMDSPTASVVSKASSYFIPGGKRLLSRSNSAMARLSTSKALAVDSWVMPIPTDSWPLNSRSEP